MVADTSPDAVTASAFSESWNHLSEGSAYTRSQFLEWFLPLDPEEFRGKSVLELGFGNGSLLVHMASFAPSRLCGVELGGTLETARRNLRDFPSVELYQGDLTQAELGDFGLVYCIGVLHHLQDPAEGFRAVLRHTEPGGRFHCWVYAREGNAIIRHVVDPLRRVTVRLPWWVTKYAVALPFVLPYFLYAKLMKALFPEGVPERAARFLPLAEYSLWIAERELGFFHHVAFDQLVTPRTVYISHDEVDRWLSAPDIEPESRYVLFRNGNSWKFGGTKRASAS